ASGLAVSFVLSAGAGRDLEGGNNFEAPKDAGAILLEFPVNAESGWLYRVRIQNASGHLVLEQRDLPSTTGKTSNVVIVAASPGGMPAGDYTAQLARRRPGAGAYEEDANLAFRITYR